MNYLLKKPQEHCLIRGQTKDKLAYDKENEWFVVLPLTKKIMFFPIERQV